MGESQPVSYRFGNFRVVPTDKRLFRDGRPVPLAPKLFDTLLLLVESGGRLLEKQEFLTRVWKDSMVEEVAIAHAISHLRKVLRNGSNASNVIETVSKRGYRFTASVETIGAELPGTSHVILAVLPFESFGASSDLEYLADGLTEEVIAALGQIEPKHISVIGRTTMMAYKRTTKSLSDIGRELGAAFLVESSVRAEDARLRITSKLIRAREQVQIWGESYDSEPASVLAFQRQLSTAIALEVRLHLSPERVGALAQRQTSHQEAYDFYLRGRYFWN